MGNGRQRADTHRLLPLYKLAGLDVTAAGNNLQSDILGVCQRMRTGQLKIFVVAGWTQEALPIPRDNAQFASGSSQSSHSGITTNRGAPISR